MLVFNETLEKIQELGEDMPVIAVLLDPGAQEADKVRQEGSDLGIGTDIIKQVLENIERDGSSRSCSISFDFC